jgi:4,4'-diaponeurosporenoate glycosyltransferase
VASFFVLVGFLFVWKIPHPNEEKELNIPPVSVIIPARNEARRIEPLLQAMAQKYPFEVEWIVVDDQSTDQTADVSRRYGAKVMTSAELPQGWFGKPWACYQGAQAATHDIFVFLDADTVLHPGGLVRIMKTFLKDSTPLSIQPYHRLTRLYEQFSLFFNLIVMMTTGLFTPFQTRIQSASFFGPCQVVMRHDYQTIGGHQAGKNAILEDIALGRAYQDVAKKTIRAMGGKGSISFRMYGEGMKQLIEGWSKNFSTGASLTPSWLLVGVSFWITGLCVLILSGIAPFMWQHYLYVYGYFLGGILTYWMGRKVGSFSLLTIVLYPVYLLFFVGLFAYSMKKTKKRRTVTWKGRNLDL